MSKEVSNADGDIAIIGMSGRFPGAKNLKEFWRNLREGIESITFLTDEELRAAGVDAEAINDPDYVRAAGVLEGIELFDASFFKFSPREAEVLDPQQRIFMECAWAALEDAGYDPDRYEGLVGVYAGTSMSSYLFQLYSNPEIVGVVGNFQIGLGNDKDNLTTAVSYKLNLKGPSMAIQTACSTSLVAVSVACDSLLSYQCDMALAGGVRVEIPQGYGYYYQEGGILSPDGHCRAFDARARGTVGGNGVGIVVLKRLKDALADGDHIHAVVKGWAVNNDGALKVGYTAPSVEGQAHVITSAHTFAGVDPRTITYVEAHGTGTELGDPIEVAALTQAFRAGTRESQFCALGSVKTNVGHLDTAAGVAGLIKAVLALKHKAIPPSLHFERPNPQINFEETPFFVNERLRDWENGDAPRRAAVNSFGIGGTNAHVVVQEAPALERPARSREEHLLVLSAKSAHALEQSTANLLEHLKREPDVELTDVAYTLQVGRKNFGQRRALVCRDVSDAVAALETLDPNRVFTSGQEASARSVVFMFPGQGAQHVGMGLGLYRTEPTFRAQVDRCCELLTPHLGRDLREVLYPAGGATEELETELRQTSLAQPALFVVEYALAVLLREWGVRPSAMIGHSIGEYVAACLAGVLSLEDALALVAARGRLMQQMPEGSMLAVHASERELRPVLNGSLSVAAVNGPSLCVVAGPTEAVRRFEEELATRGLEGRRLHTSHAFHSEMMEPILAPFKELVSSVKLNPPVLPYLSNRTGDWATDAEATSPDYWADHLRHAVRFSEGLERLLAETDSVLLEVGPGQTLGSLAKIHPAKSAGRLVLSTMRHAQDERQSDERALLNVLGRLWLAGLQVDWSGFHKHGRCRRTPLPTYPFERRRFWVEAGDAAGEGARSEVVLRKRADVSEWFYVPTWKRSAPAGYYERGDASRTGVTRWLVFEDECGLSDGLAQGLRQTTREVEVVTVNAGAMFARDDDARAYTINPRRREDYDALFADLQARGKLPDRIAHLWGVTRYTAARPGTDAFDESQARGFYSLIYLAQALGERAPEAAVRIGVVSNNVQAVTGDEEISPLKATALGPCYVIAEEYPQLSCQSIDVVLPEQGGMEMLTLEGQILNELEAEATDRAVAYRGRHRWTQTYEQVRLQSPSSTTRLRERGVYLITGGLGGIGFTIAEHLARTVRARLVLVGRSPLPERREWQRILSSETNGDDTAARIRRILALEEAGAEVLAVSADVSDFDAMRSVVARAAERFGTIDGVVHSAGVAGGRMIQLQSTDVASRVLAPKVLGTLALEAVCRDFELDFFVLCSSLSSLLGAPGQADYCGANAFLDAFAQAASARGESRVVSVNWDTWQEVGMAVNTVVPRDMEAARAASLAQGILPAEGVDALSRIISTGLPQVAVSTMDLLAQLASPPLESQSASESEAAPDAKEPGQPLHTRPALSNDYVAPRDEREKVIAEIWQELLGVEQVGIHDNFFELGGHSLLAIQFISRLRAVLPAELTLRHLFESPTVAALAAKIEPAEAPASTESSQLEDVLSMIEQLSESEVRELLAREGNLIEGDYT